MSFKFGFKPIVNSQKVAANQRETEAKKPLTVAWEKTSAMVGQVVGISGAVNVPVNQGSSLMVWILFKGSRVGVAENAKIQNGQITAQWRVTPFRSGNFTDGVYEVEVNYAGLSGKTTTPLKIVIPGGNRNVSSFGY